MREIEMDKILLLGCGGFLGANARYWLDRWIMNKLGVSFPWGTLIINVSGSFLLGLLVILLYEHGVDTRWRLFAAIGFLGAYTTFSTFTFETMTLITDGSFARAGLNVIVSVTVGMIAVWLGALVAKLI